VPVQADVHAIDVLFVDEDDRIVSQLGAKGVGEIGIVGVAAASRNAIHHATGRRVRRLPMTPDKVMAPGDGWEAGDSAFAEALRQRRRVGERVSHVSLQSELPESVGHAGVADAPPDYAHFKRRIDPAIPLGRPSGPTSD
jgi:hypothetical protein